MDAELDLEETKRVLYIQDKIIQEFRYNTEDNEFHP